MLPLRISIVTYNIWLTQRWDVRQPALGGFLKSFNPDLLCLQELQQTTRDFIDGTLPVAPARRRPIPRLDDRKQYLLARRAVRACRARH